MSINIREDPPAASRWDLSCGRIKSGVWMIPGGFRLEFITLVIGALWRPLRHLSSLLMFLFIGSDSGSQNIMYVQLDSNLQQKRTL